MWSYFEDCNDKIKEEFVVFVKVRKGVRGIFLSIICDENVNWDIVVCDIRVLFGVYYDYLFIGCVIVWIFYGIDSLCYFVEVWGWDCCFWRKYLDVEFNSFWKFVM